MHTRLLGWLLIGVLLAAFGVRAQTPPAAPALAGQGTFNQNGVILVAKFSGKVEIVVDGVSKQAAIDMVVPPKARVVTAQGASVVLVFSSGASTQLGSDTDLLIEEFLQDPFAATVKVAEMTGEPSPSRTKLMLNKGELVGNVKKLKYEQGSTFTVQTPVGAAGIRGTTFRIVFRPNGTGQAFFTLTTATGQVEFTQPNQNSGTGGTGNPDPNNPQQPTTTTTTETTGSGTAAVQVPQGQELVIVDVQITTNAQGQTVIVAMPQTPVGTTGTTAASMDAVLNVAKDIAVATQNASFSPPSANQGSGGGGQQGSNQNQGGASGDGGGTTGTTTGSTTGTTTTTTTGTTTTTNTQTSAISGGSFTGTTTTTTTTTTNPPPTTPATRPSTIPSGP